MHRQWGNARMACGRPGAVFLNNLAAGKAGMLYEKGLCSPSSVQAELRAPGKLHLLTIPSCSVLLVHPHLQTSLRCFLHLSLSPFPPNNSLQTVKWISTGVQGPPPMCAPRLGASPGLQGCPTLILPPPSLSLLCHLPCALARSSGWPVAPLVCAARWRKRSMKSQSILADHSPSPLLLLASCTHFAPLRLPLLCITQLLGCSPSLSFLRAVTSTSMKHWCLSKGDILGSHFLSKHSC